MRINFLIGNSNLNFRNRDTSTVIDNQKAIAVFTALSAGIYAMVGWNLNVSYDALTMANSALVAAKAARPYPFTSIDQEEYSKVHQEQHVRENQAVRHEVSIQLKLTNSEIMREIERIPDIAPGIASKIQEIIMKFNQLDISRSRLWRKCVRFEPAIKFADRPGCRVELQPIHQVL